MTEEVVPRWAECWRRVAKHQSRAGLEALRDALVADDPRLCQGRTCDYEPADQPGPRPEQLVSQACAVTYGAWQADGLRTVGEVEEWFSAVAVRVVEEWFSAVAVRVGTETGDPAGLRWLCNWWDTTRREVARPALLVEVERSLRERAHEAV